MIHFGGWSVAEAREYCEKYTGAVPGRSAWIRREYDVTGGVPVLQGEPADLAHLWRWLKTRIDGVGADGIVLAADLPTDDPQLADAPPWQDHNTPNPYLSDGLLWLIDGLGCYLAELTARARPGVEWGVYRASNKRDINLNRTHLFGVEGGGSVDPAGMVYTAVIGVVANGKVWDDDALTDLYRYMTSPDWRPKEG